jgi:hypothetical protein
MSATPTAPVPGVARPRWVAITAGAALACALTPLLPLLSITAWSSQILFPPYAAVPLAVATLWATPRSGGRRERLLAKLALGVMCLWAVMFVAWGLALRYGS